MTTKPTERDLFDLLATRYSGSDWVLVPQVPSGTGANKDRTADAVAMSLWPSRGLELHGFEIKVSRSDWLKELRGSGRKAEAVAAYCDRWWIVAADKSIVKADELPKAWGLLVASGTGLRVAKQAPVQEATPVDRAFVAGLLRAVERHAEQKNGGQQRKQELRAEYNRGHADGEKSVQSRINRGEYQRLRAEVDAFHEASGILIPDFFGSGKRLGELVKAAMALDPRHMKIAVGQMRRFAREFESTASGLEAAIEQIGGEA